MKSIEAVPLISNGLALILLLGLAYIAIPALLRILRSTLADFEVPESTVTLLVQYFAITLWLAVAMIALSKLTSALPPIRGIVRLIDPTLGGLARVLDVLKFAVIAVCILLVGRRMARRG